MNGPKVDWSDLQEVLDTLGNGEFLEASTFSLLFDVRFSFNELPMRFWSEDGQIWNCEISSGVRATTEPLRFNVQIAGAKPCIVWEWAHQNMDLRVAADVVVGMFHSMMSIGLGKLAVSPKEPN